MCDHYDSYFPELKDTNKKLNVLTEKEKEEETIRVPVLSKDKADKIEADKLARKHETFSNVFSEGGLVQLPEFLDTEGINHPQPIVPVGDVIDEFKDTAQKPEMVDHPAHYNQGKVECIDAIESALSREEFMGFLRGNMIKYTWRMRHKNGWEDKKKADWYGKRLDKYLTGEVK